MFLQNYPNAFHLEYLCIRIEKTYGILQVLFQKAIDKYYSFHWLSHQSIPWRNANSVEYLSVSLNESLKNNTMKRKLCFHTN